MDKLSPKMIDAALQPELWPGLPHDISQHCRGMPLPAHDRAARPAGWQNAGRALARPEVIAQPRP